MLLEPAIVKRHSSCLFLTLVSHAYVVPGVEIDFAPYGHLLAEVVSSLGVSSSLYCISGQIN